ncbi:unnamed protein product [Rotaria magnacalcarata]
MALIIDEQEEQLHHYSLIQIDEPEQIDVPIETIPPPPKHPVNEPTPNTKTKSNDSSGIKHTVLKDIYQGRSIIQNDISIQDFIHKQPEVSQLIIQRNISILNFIHNNWKPIYN